MKTSIMCLFLMAGLIVVQTPVAFAQARNDWSTVKAIGVDERLIVKTKDGMTIEGRMIEATETNLTLSRDKKVVNISRSDIQQISHSTGKAAKGKWALIGTAAGAGAGAGLGGIKYDSRKDDYGIYPIMGTFLGAGIGAAAGALFGATRRSRTVIYQAQ
jgi:hypothetical protein